MPGAHSARLERALPRGERNSASAGVRSSLSSHPPTLRGMLPSHAQQFDAISATRTYSAQPCLHASVVLQFACLYPCIQPIWSGRSRVCRRVGWMPVQ